MPIQDLVYDFQVKHGLNFAKIQKINLKLLGTQNFEHLWRHFLGFSLTDFDIIVSKLIAVLHDQSKNSLIHLISNCKVHSINYRLEFHTDNNKSCLTFEAKFVKSDSGADYSLTHKINECWKFINNDQY